MTLTVAEHAGFCFGVQRAAAFVEEAAKEKDITVCTIGELIHNPQYGKHLSDIGVRCMEIPEIESRLAKGEKIHAVIRTHGIAQPEEERLKSLLEKYPAFRLTDMTCPFVKRIHKIADRETDENTVFFLLSASGHAEAVGILSHVNGTAVPFTDYQDLCQKALPYLESKRLVILASQTTKSHAEFKKCKIFFKKHFTNPKIFDTICNVTETRQAEAESLSRKADAMIVLGGHNSSNTRQLYEICRKNCKATYWIESAEEVHGLTMDPDAHNVCITAGASTPVGLIKEIVTQWKK